MSSSNSKTKNTKRDGKGSKLLLIIILSLFVLAIIITLIVVNFNKKGSGEDDIKSKSNNPKITEVDNLGDGENYDFEAAGFLKLGKYKDVEVEVKPEDSDVYDEMMSAGKKYKNNETTTVQDGDIVYIDYTGSMEGAVYESLSEEDIYVWIGKGAFIDDFEKGLIGLQTGVQKTISCTFPQDYDDEQLAGKEVQFAIKVKRRFGADTAKDASKGKFTSVQEYFDDEYKKQVESNKEDKGELAWDILANDSKVNERPEKMYKTALEDVTNSYKNFADATGSDINDILANFGMDEDGLKQIAKETVRDVMIAKTIAKRENLTMPDDFYKEKLEEAVADEEEEKNVTKNDEYYANLEKDYKEYQGSRPKDDMLIEYVKIQVGDWAKEAE